MNERIISPIREPQPKLRGGRLLIECRGKYGLSQADLSTLAGLSQGYLSQLENGTAGQRFGYKVAIRLAWTLGQNIEFLEGIESNKVFLTHEAKVVLNLSKNPQGLVAVEWIAGLIPNLADQDLIYIQVGTSEESLNNRIRRFREDANLPQRELAGDSFLSQGHFSELENGKVENPSMQTLKNIARALKKGIHEILDIHEITYPDEVLRFDRFFRSDDIPRRTKAAVRKAIASIENLIEDLALNATRAQ